MNLQVSRYGVDVDDRALEVRQHVPLDVEAHLDHLADEDVVEVGGPGGLQWEVALLAHRPGALQRALALANVDLGGAGYGRVEHRRQVVFVCLLYGVLLIFQCFDFDLLIFQ